LRKSRPSDGDDADALVATAEVRLGAGDVEAAREAAETALALRPDNARVHLVLGRAHLAAGFYAEAVEACRRAVRLAPDLADAHRWCGFALAATGRFRDARESWERWERMIDGHAEDAQLRQVADARAAAAMFERMLGGERG
jgi:tetratricopeptide (TPR) repeat protein